MEQKNPLLQETIKSIEAKVDPDLMKTFQKMVLAGERVMYSPQTSDMMNRQLKSNPDPAIAAGEGAAKLFAILLNQSKGTLNMKVAPFAMTVLLCEALGFMEEAGKVQVTPQILAAATHEMGSAFLQVFGVTPEKLQAMMSKQGGSPGTPSPGGLINTPQGA